MELLETGDTKPFFFVQVKTTQAGYEGIENRLKVQIKRENIIGLVAYPAPTYLIGIDEPDEKGFIASVNGESIQGRSTMTIEHPLDETNMVHLWDEVNAF